MKGTHTMKTYVITGATGHTGKPIALGLLEQGHKVRVISRNPVKAKDLTDKGATLFVGDTTNDVLLKDAFTGADGVYVMIPFDALTPDYTAAQVAHVNAIGAALAQVKVPYAVTLSSIGAHLKSGNGVVNGLMQMEEAFNKIDGLNVVHLRAGYFIENTLMQAGAIKFMGVMSTPVIADLAIPMIATKDIAAAGLKLLSELSFSGKQHQYLLGAREYTYNEVASIFGAAIGKPDIPYVQASFEDGKKAMMGMGMGESVVDKLNEFIKGMNDGIVLADAQRTPASTTPTTLEEFAPVFKAIYDSN
jgi:uncharacterized protein YbjT (DUF2867 family)